VRNEVVLSVTDLTTSLAVGSATRQIVKGVSFQIKAGETLMLLGESGSGKTVTAMSILQLLGSRAQFTGSVQLGDTEMLGASDRTLQQIRGSRVALVPQDPTGALDPLMHVGAQIAEVLRVHRVERDRRKAARRAIELLDSVGIPDSARVARRYPHELSGGMRQRVAIAIGVSCSPSLLIADEPTSALDVTVQAQILNLIDELKERTGTAVLMVTHDVGVAYDRGDAIAVMNAGQIVETGAVREVLENPKHPYTAALLRAQPRPGVPRGHLPVIDRTALAAKEAS